MSTPTLNLQETDRPDDALRELSHGYKISIDYDAPDRTTLTATGGLDIEAALTSLRKDGYRVERTGPDTAAIYV